MGTLIGIWEIDVEHSVTDLQMPDGDTLSAEAAFHLATLEITKNTFSIIAPYTEMTISIGKQIPCIKVANSPASAIFRKTYDNGQFEEYSLTTRTNGTIQMVQAPDKLNFLRGYIWRRKSSNQASNTP